MVAIHCDGCLDSLKKRFLVDAGEDESGIVERFGSFGRGADADCREGMSNGSEERGFLGKRAGIGDNCGSIHLQTVVVVESERLMLYHAAIEFEAGLLKTFAAAWMAAVENRHVVLLSDGVDGIEKREEVLLGVNIFLTVCAEQYILAFFKTEALMDVACLDVGKILMKNFGHGRTGDVCAFFGKSAVGEVAARVLRIAEVYVGDDVYNAAVGFLRQTFVLATIAGLHVEDRNMQTLGGDG